MPVKYFAKFFNLHTFKPDLLLPHKSACLKITHRVIHQLKRVINRF